MTTTRTQPRYRIKRVKFLADEYDSQSQPYGIWDTKLGTYVNKWGEPDAAYYCTTKAVAQMRRRDLNEYCT
jgi:hypothetical protein